MIRITKLQVQVDHKIIINNLDLNVEAGSTHAVMGPNGSGKSTLAYALIGHPAYTVTAGSIWLGGENIVNLSPDKRAQKGLFLSFQQPPSIPGIDVLTFLKEAHNACTGIAMEVEQFRLLAEECTHRINSKTDLLYRKLNDGFSGGEKKQLEMIQLLLLRPKVVILDEIDSGLDIDALKHVAAGIAYAKQENPDLAVVIITHYQHILRSIVPDVVHIMCDGAIVESGNAQLAYDLEKKGYDAYRS